MQQQTTKPTEIICFPDSIKFGGVTFRKTDRKLKPLEIEYEGFDALNRVRLRIYRYPYEQEQWLWNARFLGIEVNNSIAHEYELGICVDTMDDALSNAINAYDDWLDDMQRILRTLRPGDRYALGFEDGKSVIKSKVIGALQ